MRGGPPRTIDRDRARALYAELGSYAAVARRMGHSTGGVMRALNPERAQRYAAKQDAKPERKRAKRAWENEHDRYPCPKCGDLMGAGSRRSGHVMCIACRQQQNLERVEQRCRELELLWAEGRSYRELMAHFGWTRGYLSVVMNDARERGFNLPYRHNGYTKFAHLSRGTSR